MIAVGFPCNLGIKLTASDAAAGDRYAHFVSMSVDFALIGARFDDDTATDSGSAWLYDCTGGACNAGVKLTADDAAASDWFGASLSLSGTTALVGAPGVNSIAGAAYLFDCSGGTCDSGFKYTASDADIGDEYGHTVAISNSLMLIGSRRDDIGGSNNGSAYIYPLP